MLSFEIIWEPKAAFYEFLMYSLCKVWYSTLFRYIFVAKPGALDNFILTKNRVGLVDLPKGCCEQKLFSKPRQLMSVVEGREVFVNYTKKVFSVISKLMFDFLLD